MKKLSPIFMLLGICLMLLVSSCKKDDPKSSAKSITEFSIDGVIAEIDENAKTITITLPYGTNINQLSPTFKVSEHATASPAPSVVVNFSKPVQYIVKAEDGSTQSYTVVVYVATSPEEPTLSAEKQLLEFSIGSVVGTIDEENKTVLLVLPADTDRSQLTPAIKVSEYATVNPEAAEADFSQPVKYTVTAQNGTKQQYIVTVELELEIVAISTTVAVPGGRVNIACKNLLSSGNQVILEGTDLCPTIIYENDFRLAVILPDNIPSGAYTIKIQAGSRSITYKDEKLKILDASIAPRLISLNKTEIIRGLDDLEINGVNLPTDRISIFLQKKSNVNEYEYTSFSVNGNTNTSCSIPMLHLQSYFWDEYYIWLSVKIDENTTVSTNRLSFKLVPGSSSDPVISGIFSRKSLCAGGYFNISGNNFSADSEVRLLKTSGGHIIVPIEHASVKNIYLITDNVPADIYKGISIITGGKIANYTDNIVVDQCPAPEVISISPQQVSVGTEVKITGKNLLSLGLDDYLNIRITAEGKDYYSPLAKIVSDTEAVFIYDSIHQTPGEYTIEISKDWGNREKYASFPFVVQ